MTPQEQKLREALRIMEAYLHLRLEMRDWHGVMDAAADIRELEAQIRILSRQDVESFNP